jgi:hypothetical protein
VFGASLSELGFAAVLLALVLLAQVAPRLGEAIGARLGGPQPPSGGGNP